MLTSEESKSMDDCVQGLMNTLREHKAYIGMGSMSLLLVSYMQEGQHSLEHFLEKMVQCWQVLKDGTDTKSKGKEDADEKDDL